LRFSLRELLCLTFAAALGAAWWTESFRSRQWQQRAEIAASHIETENLGKIAFLNHGVLYQSRENQAPFDEIFTPTEQGR
jgi:hypothetical protein